MNSSRRLYLGAVAVVAVLIVAGYALSANNGGKTSTNPGDNGQQLEQLRIGQVPGALTSPHYTAMDQGFYRDHGFDAQLKTMPGPEIGKAVVQGDIEIGSGATTPAVYQRNANVPIKFVASRAGYPVNGKGAVLAVRNGVNISSPEDFKGKTICSSTSGSMGELFLHMWADKNNLKIGDDFKLTFLGDENSYKSAFASGSVDACYLDTPMALAMLEKRDLAHPYYWMDKGQYVTAFVSVSDRMVNNHPDKLKRFLEAYNEAATYARNHPEERIAAIANHTQYTEAQLHDMRLPPVPKNLSVNVTTLNEVRDLMYKYGLVDEKHEMGSMVDNSFINQVQNQ